jgi:hypothetical protein
MLLEVGGFEEVGKSSRRRLYMLRHNKSAGDSVLSGEKQSLCTGNRHVFRDVADVAPI